MRGTSHIAIGEVARIWREITVRNVVVRELRLGGTPRPTARFPLLAGRESVHASRYGTATLPANPSKPFADDGAKYNGTSPANGSASAATCGTTTDWHVAL